MAELTYLSKQSDISRSMRSITCNLPRTQLNKLQGDEEYKLQQNETLYLAVMYIDRSLTYMFIQWSKL